jgi:hypothetical protein
MFRMTPCPSCHTHVLVEDRQCPHCGATLRTTGAPLAAAVIAGLMLTSCVAEPEYGVPDTTGPDPTTGATSSTGTDSGGTTADPMTGSGGVDYGTADSVDETDGTGGSSSAGEPEYGVPETSSTTDGTTSVGEPEYGVPETSTTG